MKIALVSEFFYPTLGGVQEHLYNVAKQYIRKGHDTKIITPKVFTSIKFEDWWPKDLPPDTYLPVGKSLPFFINGSRGRLCVDIGLGQKLRELLTPENFDIVHLHAPLNGTLPILANHFSTTCTVGTFHTSFPGSKSLSLLKKLAQRQLDKLDCILGVSPISIESISQYVTVEAQIVPNGIDTEFFRPLQKDEARVSELNDGRFNIVFVGRPDPRNGLDTLILAFAKVFEKESRARLVIVGGGDGMERYRAMTKFLPPESVLFMGALREDRAAVYRSGDIHVFGVEKATFSITVLEGMASGLPVVTTPFEGHRALGEPGKHFMTTPFGDVDALANELLSLMNDPEKRHRLGTAARAHSLSFDWSLVADHLLDIYKTVLGRSVGESISSTSGKEITSFAGIVGMEKRAGT